MLKMTPTRYHELAEESIGQKYLHFVVDLAGPEVPGRTAGMDRVGHSLGIRYGLAEVSQAAFDLSSFEGA
jgi:hypothetical protein